MSKERTINPYLSTIDLQTKLSKQAEKEQKHASGKRFDGRQIGAGIREIGDKVVPEDLGGWQVQCRKWRSRRTYRHNR